MIDAKTIYAEICRIVDRDAADGQNAEETLINVLGRLIEFVEEEEAMAALPLQLRFAEAKGDDFEAMRDAVRLTPLYQQGDGRLIWVNEGDLGTMVAAGYAKDCTSD